MRRPAPSSCISTAMSASSAPSARSPWASAANAGSLRARAHLHEGAAYRRVNLRGALQQGRDGARRVPPAGARDGPLVLPLPGRWRSAGRSSTLFDSKGCRPSAGLAMFTGAMTAIVNPEGERLDSAVAGRARSSTRCRCIRDATPSTSASHDIDLTDLEPIIVIPPTPAEHPQPLGLSRDRGPCRLPRLLRVRPHRGPARRGRGAARAGRSSRASSSTWCRPANEHHGGRPRRRA